MHLGQILVGFVGFFLLRFIYVLPIFFKKSSSTKRRRSRRDACPTALILGSGGHTFELLDILSHDFCWQSYSPLSVLVSHNDALSLKQWDLYQRTQEGLSVVKCSIFSIHRPRNVHSQLFTLESVKNIFLSLRDAFHWIIHCHPTPELVICNGPGLCIPILIAVYFAKIFGKNIKIIYIESFARVNRLSLTGRLLYFLVDRFIIQWPSLTASNRRAEYLGQLL